MTRIIQVRCQVDAESTPSPTQVNGQVNLLVQSVYSADTNDRVSLCWPDFILFKLNEFQSTFVF